MAGKRQRSAIRIPLPAAWDRPLAEAVVRVMRLGAFPTDSRVSLPNGMLHAVRDVDGRAVRYHLRLEPDGGGILIADAAAAVRLSPAATRMAVLLMGDGDAITALEGISQTALDPETSDRNGEVVRVMRRLGDPELRWRYPISALVLGRDGAPRAAFRAPLEADVPLPGPAEIGPLVDRLWHVGIPHVTFQTTGPFDPAALVRAVERAEDIGMIAGVRGRATDLAGGSLVEDLASAGVDHVNVIVASSDPLEHDPLLGAGDHAAAVDVLARLKAADVCPVAEIPLTQATSRRLEATLAWLVEHGVGAVECFAIATGDDTPPGSAAGALAARALPQILATLEHAADTSGIQLYWANPVRRDPARPMVGQVLAGARCAGLAAVRVEPDGRVMPPEGPARSAGNLLTDPWESVWAAPAFAAYRAPGDAPPRCDVCPGLATCAAGCPRDESRWTWEDDA